MIKAYIFYPNQPGVRFDMTYYCERHMPMVKARIGAACTGFTVDSGLGGGAPGQPAPYVAIGMLMLSSVEAFGAAMAQHGAEVMGDVANYTDAQPVIQFCEVKVA